MNYNSFKFHVFRKVSFLFAECICNLMLYYKNGSHYRASEFIPCIFGVFNDKIRRNGCLLGVLIYSETGKTRCICRQQN